jgi:hypothetical protein
MPKHSPDLTACMSSSRDCLLDVADICRGLPRSDYGMGEDRREPADVGIPATTGHQPPGISSAHGDRHWW